ncbi:uncharacterized protein LOC122065177 isoform X1 [Macadamia integrifolia]|uniref:uncharacterized protein LOC122065177 isoform X1 n=1 Tax=Macadamia integrifolia TaxID=60698 RepID=UPI001C501159|nr:uncharacterized protein LOC122065177 isoform X1 [Macadamia integrifolia]XP_042484915.1 uncharacterized protein LOC122065177 isoform X1 [Macadamia integrifolia]XP_042484916.1 uncharacterized protein LOC122065177 isoform X1 [Macadamia integrifolia]XP_042484917.1 uncharacterized protein LOC122065177 isoform X1 [Macadamia integrifolia]XP_042484918.1 uncharacterized protein LOC122065177 isoform X1 [Macadamia integrifolia]
MGKREGNRRGQTPSSSVHQGMLTLREESGGRKQTKGGSNNVKSILKKQHLQNLSLWAGGEVSIPSMGALFGHRLADCAEAMGTPVDPSLFLCQRCETILQPGYNCTIRIEKNRARVRRRHKKLNNPTQNNVVYTCHFCSQRNLKKGTPKGHMKEICVSRPRPASELERVNSAPQESTILEKGIEGKEGNNNIEESISLEKTSISGSESGNLKKGAPKGHMKEICVSRPKPASELERVSSAPLESTILEKGVERKQGNNNVEESISLEKTSISGSKSGSPEAFLATHEQIALENIPITPLVKTSRSLLEGKGKKRKKKGPGSNQAGGSECNSATADTEGAASGSSKRRRKSWTTLKEIVEHSQLENNHKITNLSIPFFFVDDHVSYGIVDGKS